MLKKVDNSLHIKHTLDEAKSFFLQDAFRKKHMLQVQKDDTYIKEDAYMYYQSSLKKEKNQPAPPLNNCLVVV